ncbi:MAG: PfkB family carbohydrate kinase [Sphaerochaetaceae bacterium]|nr:PfkB family carbohydrate kinase [Sphaerochaetaceae bacterium]
MDLPSVLTVCLSPTFQKTIVFDDFHEDEVNRSADYHICASGKGINVSRVLLHLGRNSVNLTHLGGSRVDEFLGLCDAEGISVEFVRTLAPIRTCTTIINRKKNTSTELIEETLPVAAEVAELVFDKFAKALPAHAAVVISGTKAPGYTDDIFPRMTAHAKKLGKLVVLDIKGNDLEGCLPCVPDIIKPNLSEFVATFMPGRRVLENEDTEGLYREIEALTRTIYDTYGVKSVITRGKFDTWAFDGSSLRVIPNVDVPVVNTIGCGDTLTAATVHALLSGREFCDAVGFGMDCAVRRASKLSHGITE